MSLTDQEKIAIAEWGGWKYQGDLARPDRKWQDPSGAWCPSAVRAFAEDPIQWVPLFERLAKMDFILLWDEGTGYRCGHIKLGVDGTGAMLGEAVCRAVLAVIASEKAAQDLSSTKSKEEK